MWFTFLEWWLCLGNWLSGGWLIFAIYYTAIYCGHNSMATKWRAKVFDSEKRRTGNSVPQDAYPLDSSCLSSRISACFARFLGGGGGEGWREGVPEEEEKWWTVRSTRVTVGWNVNEIGWKIEWSGWYFVRGDGLKWFEAWEKSSISLILWAKLTIKRVWIMDNLI